MAVASSDELLKFLRSEVRQALAVLDELPLPDYFDKVAAGDPLALALLRIYDHLFPAMNIIAAHDAAPGPPDGHGAPTVPARSAEQHGGMSRAAAAPARDQRAGVDASGRASAFPSPSVPTKNRG